MEAILYDKKIKEMQQYIPFLENLIAKLEKNKDGGPNPKEAYLTKMQMLYGLLTKKDKKLKFETLKKCESVLSKLHNKIEKNNVDQEKKALSKSAGQSSGDFEDLSPPASPQNSDNTAEFHAPIEIPIERRASPVSPDSRRYHAEQNVDRKKSSGRTDRSSRDSRNDLYRRRSPNRSSSSKKFTSTKYDDNSDYSYDKYDKRQRDEYRREGSNYSYEKTKYYERRSYSNSPSNEMWKKGDSKSNSSESSLPKQIFNRLGEKLDVVSKNYENFSIQIKNDAVRNDTEKNDTVKKNRAPTPLSEVLKSPPLSANDIDDLLNESEEKADKDERRELSELEAVRKKLNTEIVNLKQKAKEAQAAEKHPKRMDKNEKVSIRSDQPTDKNSLNYLSLPSKSHNDLSAPRKVLHSKQSTDQQISISSPRENNFDTVKPLEAEVERGQHEMQRKNSEEYSSSQDEKDPSKFRLAYKYNPHPRKVTESPKCEEPVHTNAKRPSDPRVNRSSINTLPSVNLADPRLRNRPMNYMMPDGSPNPLQLPSTSTGPPLPVPPPVMELSGTSPPFSPQEIMRPSVLPGFPIFGSFVPQIGSQISSPAPIIIPTNSNINHSPQPMSILPSSMPMQVPNPLVCSPSTPTIVPSPFLSVPSVKSHDIASRHHNYNKFQPMLNDKVERMKYFESKKQKHEPRTYGEYKQAKLADKLRKEKTENKYKKEQKSRKYHKDEKHHKDKKKEVDKKEQNTKDELLIPKKEPGESLSMNNFKIPKLSKSNQNETDTVKKGKEADIDSSKDKKTSREQDKKHSSTTDDEKRATSKSEVIKNKQKTTSSTKSETEKQTISITDSEKQSNKTQQKMRKSNKDVETETEDNAKSEPPPDEDWDATETKEIIETDTEKPKKQKSEQEKIEKETNENSVSKEKEEEDVSFVSNPVENDGVVPEAFDKIAVKPRARRHKATDIVQQTSDACEISTQNIITGKRRSRTVVPPPAEIQSPEVKVSRKSKKRTVLNVDNDEKDEKAVDHAIVGKAKVKMEKENDQNICLSSKESSKVTVKSENVENDEDSKIELNTKVFEGFLLNMFNPAKFDKEGALSMLEKVLDKKKFDQIKQILSDTKNEECQADYDKKVVAESPAEDNIQPSAIVDEKNKLNTDLKGVKTVEHKKKKTELDRLNEDIRDMFISQGVLTATGRRMCTIMHEEKKQEEVETPKQKSQKANEKSSLMSKPPKVALKRLTKRGKAKGYTRKSKPALIETIESESNSENESIDSKNKYVSPKEETIIIDISDESDVIAKVTESNQLQKKVKMKHKPCPKSKRKYQHDSDGDSGDEMQLDIVERTELNKSPVMENVQEVQTDSIEEDRSDIQLVVNSDVEDTNTRIEVAPSSEGDDIFEPEKQLRKKRNVPFWGKGKEKNTTFKNIYPEMHIKSSHARKCVLCGFVGKRMCNHYVHAHPQDEVPISRLPPHILERIKSGAINKAFYAYKKVDNNFLYQFQCPFCNIKSSLSRRGWADHFGTHTGEYAYKCSDCNRFLNIRQNIQKHVKQSCPKGRVITLRDVEKDSKKVLAYVCDICNYIQMNRYSVINHLKNQHGEEDEVITTITLICCENVPVASCFKRAEIIEENRESRLKKDTENDENYKDDNLDGMEMFEHSIFNDMAIVDRLSERFQNEFNQQNLTVVNSSTNPDLNLLGGSNQESGNLLEESMSVDNCESSSLNIIPEMRNDPSTSMSIAERLCQRFRGMGSSTDPATNPKPSSPIERFSRFSDSDGTRISTEGENQSVVYVVDKFDEEIANAEHVNEAAEIKLPGNDNNVADTMSELLNDESRESVPPKSTTLDISISESFESPKETDSEDHSLDTTASLVEKIKMQLNTRKSGKKNVENKKLPGECRLQTTEISKGCLQLSPGTSYPQRKEGPSFEDHPALKAGLSIVERLTERLKSSDGGIFGDEGDSVPSPPEVGSSVKTASAECSTKALVEPSNNDGNTSFEGDLVIDEDDVKDDNSSQVVEMQKNSAEKKSADNVENHTSTNDNSSECEIFETQDDDNDDWEDIEILPSDTVTDIKKLPTMEKAKRNQFIFKTFSKLYGLSNQKSKEHKGKKVKNDLESMKTIIKSENDEATSQEFKEEENLNNYAKEVENQAVDTEKCDDVSDFEPLNENSRHTEKSQKGDIALNVLSAECTDIEDPMDTDTALISSSELNMMSVPFNEGHSAATHVDPLAKDLGDISGLLGLSLNQMDVHEPSATATDSLDIPDVSVLNPSILTLSDEGNLDDDVTFVSSVESKINANTVDLRDQTNKVQDNAESSEKDLVINVMAESVDQTQSNNSQSSNNSVVHRINKLGYSINHDKNIKYFCLVDSCTFLYSELSVGLDNHILVEHSQLLWEGYCNECKAQVASEEQMSLSKELNHMLTVHIKKLEEKAKQLAVKSKPPLIKLRKLSGDVLSANYSNKVVKQSGSSLLEEALAHDKVTSEETNMVVLPKILNKTLEPEQIPPPLKFSTTTVKNIPNRVPQLTTDNRIIFDSYLVRNNLPVPTIKTIKRCKPNESVQSTTIVLNQPLRLSTEELNIQHDINEDLHHKNSNAEPFFKIKEVVSLNVADSSTISVDRTSPIPSTSSGVGSTVSVVPKPNIVHIPISSTASTTKQTNVSNSVNKIQAQNVVETNRNSSPASQNFVSRYLKPWIHSSSYKSRNIANSQLKLISLYARFKCMGYNCNFTTNSEEVMTLHFEYHRDVKDAKEKFIEEKHKQCWRECPYCNFTDKFLMNHMTQVHINDIYQCPYCFYRSCVDNNVVIHVRKYHRAAGLNVLVCFGKPKELQSEIGKLAKLRRNNVEPIQCSDCPKVFYILRNFLKHLDEHSSLDGKFKCNICSDYFKISAAENHLSTKHYIGVYECIYCSYGTERMDFIKLHVVNRHPSFLAYMCIRLSPNRVSKNTTETLESSTVLANLSDKVDPGLLIHCPFTSEQLKECKRTNNKPAKRLTEKEKNLASNMIIQSISVQDSKYSKKLEISSVQSISTEDFNKLEENCPLPSTIVEPTSTISSQPSHKIMSELKPTIETITKSSRPKTKITTNTESGILAREQTYMNILEAAKEMVQNTGIKSSELYKCAECENILTTPMDFHLHIQEHMNAGLSEVKCFHCNLVTKNLLVLKNHLKTHFIHRYFCYFCSFTAPTGNTLVKHVNDTHSKTGVLSFPLILGRTHRMCDFFVIAPKTVKQIDIFQFGERMVRAWERKRALTKKYYKPDEINLLPRQAIFFAEVFCEMCGYRTKVRTNMFRHLQFHKQELRVATVDPINPVPCLNSSERHFDKMLNLACSSNVNRDKPKEELKLPEYVPLDKRFVCGAPDCTYLSINENMMKWHVSALHSDEKIYICPHCKIEVCKKLICPERVLNHLKFHDSKLFVCNACNYVHHQKHIVERHVNEKHPGLATSIISHERSESGESKIVEIPSTRKNSAGAGSSPLTKDEQQMKWECGLCKIRKPTYNQMISHTNQAHDVKHRYQCVHCSYGGTQVHQITSHIADKHPTKVKEARCIFYRIDDALIDLKPVDNTIPIWTRDPCRVKNIRGILMEDEEESNKNISTDYYEEDAYEEAAAYGDRDTNISELRYDSPVISLATDGESSSNVEDSSKPIKTYSNPLKNNKNSYACEECSFFAKTTSELQHHMKIFNHKALEAELEHYVFSCYYCSYRSQTMATMKKHWQEKHSSLKNNKYCDIDSIICPFWFKTYTRTQCIRCSYKNDALSVAEHLQIKHPGLTKVVINTKDKNKCNQCSYKSTNLKDLALHFGMKHCIIAQVPPEFTDEDLTKLQKHGLNQKFIKCLQCNQIPVAPESFQNHHDKTHFGTASNFEYIQGEVLFLCSQCPFVSDEETTLCHMQSHTDLSKYKCFNCQSTYNTFKKFADHLTEDHKKKPNADTIYKGIQNQIKELLEIRIVLPNGMIIEKGHLNKSKLGCDTALIKKIVHENFAPYLKSIDKSLDEILFKESCRSKITGSSVPSTVSSPIPSTSGMQKRRRGPEMGNIDEYDDDDEWCPKTKKTKRYVSKKSSCNPLIEAATPTTENTAEKVELSKVYTTMTIGGSEVPITCDSFAKLVKINTRVKLERMDLSQYIDIPGSIPGKRKTKSDKTDVQKKIKNEL